MTGPEVDALARLREGLASAIASKHSGYVLSHQRLRYIEADIVASLGGHWELQLFDSDPSQLIVRESIDSIRAYSDEALALTQRYLERHDEPEPA